MLYENDDKRFRSSDHHQVLHCFNSAARSPKTGGFERVLVRGREMGERGEKESRGQGEKEMGREARLISHPVLPFHERASNPDIRTSGEGRGCFAV